MGNVVVVTGTSSGLGMYIARELEAVGREVIGLDLEPGERTEYHGVDVRYRADIRAVAREILSEEDSANKVIGVINCAGVNQIDWLPDLKDEDWDRIMDTNAKSIFLMAQAFAPYLDGGFICNIVSNAAHMPMRCSLAYNASKGAAHIMTLQLARELSPKVSVFGVAPNRLAGTGMSEYIDERVLETRGWTREEARRYQLSSLLAGEETDPERCAELIAFLCSTRSRYKYLTGTVIPYGA